MTKLKLANFANAKFRFKQVMLKKQRLNSEAKFVRFSCYHLMCKVHLTQPPKKQLRHDIRGSLMQRTSLPTSTVTFQSMINQGHYHCLPDVYSREAPNIRMASDGRLLLLVANNQISCNPTSTNQALAFKIFAVIPKAQIGSIALKLHCNHF